jgi:hypothetical protein
MDRITFYVACKGLGFIECWEPNFRLLVSFAISLSFDGIQTHLVSICTITAISATIASIVTSIVGSMVRNGFWRVLSFVPICAWFPLGYTTSSECVEATTEEE